MKFCSVYFRFVAGLLLCTGTVLSVSAQRKAPGYMGKRFLLKYDQGISWSFGSHIRGIPNLHYTLQGDMAVTKKHSVGAEYSFMTRNYEKNMGSVRDYTASFEPYGQDLYCTLDRMMMHRVGIYTKMFSQSNGHIAPAGPYFAVGAYAYFLQSAYRTSKTSFGAKTREDRFTGDFAPFIGGGKQYIVANRMVISVDLRLSLPILGLANAFNRGLHLGAPKTQEAKENRAMTGWSTWANAQANFIELRMGLGTLL